MYVPTQNRKPKPETHKSKIRIPYSAIQFLAIERNSQQRCRQNPKS